MMPAQRFCVSCGSPLALGVAFCNKCGAAATPATPQVTAAQHPVGETDAASTTPPSGAPFRNVSVPNNVPPPTNQTTGTKGKGCATAIIGALVVVVLIAITIIGGMIYVAHKAKNKLKEFAATQLHQAQETLAQTPSRTTDDMSDVPGSFPPNARLMESCPDASSVVDTNGGVPRIPLKEGLTWVDTWRRFNGDVEVINRIEEVTPNHVRTSSSGMAFANNQAVQGTEISTHRVVCRTDLQSANVYVTENRATFPEIMPQTTTFSMSQKSLKELKSNGKFTIAYVQFVQTGNRLIPVTQAAELQRVEPDDVNYPVILNGQPANVPVIHVRGHFHFSGVDKVKKLYRDPSFLDADGELFILDDPLNPVTLLFTMGPVFQLRIVSITYPEDKPKPQIEDQLAKQKKAVVYGIYFDFNQASIKKESEPVLKEIAEAMKNNPDWALTVNGYTDNIGGDAYNLELSKKRAASVKEALVDRYGIATTRLTIGGFGASGPVDTNETLEGRARNRRVELIRQ